MLRTLHQVEGSVQLQLSANAVGVFEAFSSNIKPIVLLTLNKSRPRRPRYPQLRAHPALRRKFSLWPRQWLCKRSGMNAACSMQRGVQGGR